jgi:hypothetical protein
MRVCALYGFLLAASLLTACGDDDGSQCTDGELRLVGSYEDLGLSTESVFVSGDLAYIADDDRFVIVSVANAAFPEFRGEYTSTWANYVWVEGNYAYVLEDMGYVILDVSDPTDPQVAGTWDAEGRVQIRNSRAYAKDPLNGGLAIYDLTDPVNPQLLGTLDNVYAGDDLAVQGDFVYLVYFGLGLQIVDASDPVNPALVSELTLAGGGWAVEVAGDYAYVAADDDGLVIVDISVPDTPVEVGSFPFPHIRYVAVLGDTSYVAGMDDVLAVDVSEPTSPVELSRMGTHVNWLTTHGDCIYTITTFRGMEILSATCP